MSQHAAIDYDLLAQALLRQRAGGSVERRLLDGVDAHGDPVAGSAVSHVSGEVDGGVSSGSEVDVGLPESEAMSVGGSDSGGSMSGGVPPAVPQAVRGSVVFGSFSAAHKIQSVGSTEGYFRTVVRRSEAVKLRAKLKSACGLDLPKHARADLALCTFASGVMPAVAVDGKRKLRGLAHIGDASITLHLLAEAYAAGRTVEQAQAARSRLTSDDFFKKVMVRTGMAECLTVPSGVDIKSSKPTATAFEAIVGVLTLHMSNSQVCEALRMLGVFEK